MTSKLLPIRLESTYLNMLIIQQKMINPPAVDSGSAQLCKLKLLFVSCDCSNRVITHYYGIISTVFISITTGNLEDRVE